MNDVRYKELISETMQNSLNTLTAKASEYARKEDMFHNFEVAAVMQDCTKEEALRGMLSKTIVSIWDMIPRADKFPDEVWQEKIGDAINYLLILSAMVKE